MISITQCPICKGNDITPVFKCTDYTVSKIQFEIKECSTCTFRFTSPRPTDEELGKYYLSDDYISHSNTAKKFIDKLYLIARSYTLRWKKNLVTSLLSPTGTRELLDYGCGTGSFLQYMIQNGWKVQGIEPSEQARKIAHAQTGISIQSSIKELDNKTFDIITLWHVLEHIPDPHEILDRLATLLANDGALLIAVPNHKSREEGQYKNQWAGYDVPRHLWHFNQATMQKLVAQHGLRIASTIPMKLDAYYISLLSEKYRNNNHQSPFHLPKALIAGLRSNRAARKDNEYSSLIYVIKK